MGDHIPEEIKLNRLNDIIEAQRAISFQLNQEMIGTMVEVLVEGESKKSADEFCGRTDTNKTVVFPKNELRSGEYIRVNIERANSATLFGTPVMHNQQLQQGEAA